MLFLVNSLFAGYIKFLIYNMILVISKNFIFWHLFINFFIFEMCFESLNLTKGEILS